jgi:hypothetical protein
LNHLVDGNRTLKDDDNYLPREDGNTNYDIAYYFPLRNEKNSTFLSSHLLYLEEELERVDLIVETSLSIFESLEHQNQQLFKDVQIYRRRLIALGMIEGQTETSFNKTLLLDHLQRNMSTNVRCKMEIVGRLTQEKNYEFDCKNEQLEKAKSKRVVRK